MSSKSNNLVRLTILAMIGLLPYGCAPSATPVVTPAAAPTTQPAATPEAKPAAPSPSPKPAADQPRYGSILTVSTSGDPITLDMHQEASYLAANVLQCAYNGVVQLDPQNPEEVIGDLAKSWEISKDGVTYTFRLNDNMKFHDGSASTSEDARYSFDRQINPPKGIMAPRRADLAAIDKIEAPDKDTLKFLLKYPSSSFLSVISSGWMVVAQKALIEKKGTLKGDVMGTGPFKFKNYATGTSLEFLKNPAYFVPGRLYLDGITFYIVKDAGTRLAAFRTGQIKLTGPSGSGFTPSDAETIRKNMPQAVLLSYSGLQWHNFVLNTLEKPWSDIRVRKAAHMAVDRQTAIEVLAQGYGDLGSYFPGSWGIPRDELVKIPGWRQPHDQDVAEAKKLLADAGYPNGFTVKGLVRAEKLFEELAIYVADQLGKVGIKLDLDVKETAVRTNLLNQGAFSIHPTESSLSYPDPENVTRYWGPPLNNDWGQNWQRNSEKDIWDLFEKQSKALDPSERKKIVHELDLKMIDSASRPVIYWRNSIIGMWPEVKGRGKVIGNHSFQKYQDVWLAK